jgi:hypothetical protein
MIQLVSNQILILNLFLISFIIASNVPNLMIQGQAMNIINGNGSNRQQWSGASRGTIISVLERARARDHTMSSTMTSTDNNETSNISLINLAKRIDPDRKNETYVIPNSDVSSNSTCEILNKPIISDLVVEDFDSTLTTQTRQDDKKE